MEAGVITSLQVFFSVEINNRTWKVFPTFESPQVEYMPSLLWNHEVLNSSETCRAPMSRAIQSGSLEDQESSVRGSCEV